MLQAAAGLDALRVLCCGTRTVPLRTRHTFSGAAYFNFSHVSGSDRVLNPWKTTPKTAASPRQRPWAQQPRGVEVFLVRWGEDVGTNSAACLPAAAAPLWAASPAVTHARCVISHFIGRGKKKKQGWTSVSFQMEEPKQRQQINSFRDIYRPGRHKFSLDLLTFLIWQRCLQKAVQAFQQCVLLDKHLRVHPFFSRNNAKSNSNRGLGGFIHILRWILIFAWKSKLRLSVTMLPPCGRIDKLF